MSINDILTNLANNPGGVAATMTMLTLLAGSAVEYRSHRQATPKAVDANMPADHSIRPPESPDQPLHASQ